MNVHHNAVTLNASEGDELFSASPSGAGGVAFCTGADNYQFNYNWVCGNLSTGDGAGVAQMGFVWDGSIQHNSILFNQATNPTTPSNGGGLLIMNAPDSDPICPGEADKDCALALGSVGDGIGRNLVINANLIVGNAAEAGSGGGIRFQGVNGVEVSTFPRNPERWYSVNVTNNIITNNVAGWDGGGVSLQDSLVVNLINNTIVSNDSTASSGSLFGAFFAPEASSPTPCPRDATGASTRCVPLSDPQPAGLSSARHSAEFLRSLTGSIDCPVGHGLGGTGLGGRRNGACRTVSFPILYNDVLWQNRAFNIVVTQPGAGSLQSTVRLAPTPAANEITSTGQCFASFPTGNYWDLGLRGDHGATNHASGFTFTPQASVLTSTVGYTGGGSGFKANTDFSSGPGLVHPSCNGSKIPAEVPNAASVWYQVPPGTFEGNVPTPVFSLTAGATVDEGNNWVNISWGPLSLIAPASENNPAAETFLSDYSLAAGSHAINYITNANSTNTYSVAPNEDFFGTLRKTNGSVDVGAVEFGANVPLPTLTSISPASSGRGVAVPVTLTGTNLTGTSAVNVSGTGITVSNVTVVNATTVTALFTISGSATVSARTVSVTTPGGTSNTVTFTVTAGTLTFTNATNGSLASFLGVQTLSFTIPSPRAPVTSVVTMTNTGAAPLQITAETITLNTSFFSVTANTCSFTAPLAPGAACTASIRYATPNARPFFPNIGAMTAANNGTSSGVLALLGQ